MGRGINLGISNKQMFFFWILVICCTLLLAMNFEMIFNETTYISDYVIDLFKKVQSFLKF